MKAGLTFLAIAILWLNSVQISNDNSLGKSLEADPKGMKNSVEIDKKGNWVTIQQSEDGGKVKIKQIGNIRQISILQTYQNAIN